MRGEDKKVNDTNNANNKIARLEEKIFKAINAIPNKDSFFERLRTYRKESLEIDSSAETVILENEENKNSDTSKNAKNLRSKEADRSAKKLKVNDNFEIYNIQNNNIKKTNTDANTNARKIKIANASKDMTVYNEKSNKKPNF